MIRVFVDEYTFKQRLVEEGACQLLIPLLSHADCDVIRNSAMTLSLLTNHHSARTAIANDNGQKGVVVIIPHYMCIHVYHCRVCIVQLTRFCFLDNGQEYISEELLFCAIIFFNHASFLINH